MDVVGIPVPPPAQVDGTVDNWRLTGETRTHYLLGGALLVADWVRVAAADAKVVGPTPCKPAALCCGESPDQPLTPTELLEIASRLTRDEIVHSLLNLDQFPATPKAGNADTMRVEHKHGFSGPQQGDPGLKLLPPECDSTPDFLVLDDTGNRFRRSPDQWPNAIKETVGSADTIVVYKLHRPLPMPATSGAEDGETQSPQKGLWETVAHRFPDRRVVIVSIDDLRDKDAPISRGLSWERTALELVWQLLNVETFAVLRDCSHLIVRMGLDGALYWHHCNDQQAPYHAWLIYDPAGIEGTGESLCKGQMVGYGSAFTAALVQHLAQADAASCLSPGKGKNDKGHEVIASSSRAIEDGIRAGLVATRRLLQIGFGNRADGDPKYPSQELFADATRHDPFFACQKVPIIPHAATPDRGYWRLLDSIFEGKTALLHRAVALTATRAKAAEAEDRTAAELLRQVPVAVFAKALRTYDRREIENYRSLYALMLDYIRQPTPPRPLSVAVFGPPGAGKSFGVKQVAKALGELSGSQPIKTLTFNLSQYHMADQLADAFHLVRDLVLQGNVPLVFFDEFDTSLGGISLGWLRYFLAPMQDAEFLDRGTPHPIGRSIFVFAGGTCGTYADFAAPLKLKPKEATKEEDVPKEYKEFKFAKGPDFLSRLRGTLDVPGLDLHTSFDPFGPVESFPCEAAILLRRAGILAHQLGEKAPHLPDSGNKLRVSPAVLRTLLHLPQFEHGNRSLEAILDMSHLPDAELFTPSLLPFAAQADLHVNSVHFGQLLATDYPFPPEDREKIAVAIHKRYVEQRLSEDPKPDPNEPALRSWSDLREDLRNSNREQADHIAVKLRAAGLWFRKIVPGSVQAGAPNQHLEALLEELAKSEHDRWVAEKRRQGWMAAPDTSRESRNDSLWLHNCLFRWDELTDTLKDLDRATARHIPETLASVGYEVYKP